MELKFTKMEGLGNDYIYVDATKEDIRLSEEQIVRVSDRHFGVGGDGVIFIRNSDKGDFMMDMYNADGSWSEMCGNGIRCVAKYIYDHGLKKSEQLKIETGNGVLTLDLDIKNGKAEYVSVDMGEPILTPSKIPVKWENEEKIIGGKIKSRDREFQFTSVSMGNPHAVIFVEDTDDFPVHEYGPPIENNGIFPNRVNVEFVTLKGKNHLLQRTWERGSGETLACGTGACAVMVASHLNGKTDKKVQIDLLGGTLYIEWLDNNHVIMKGPAKEVFSGVINL